MNYDLHVEYTHTKKCVCGGGDFQPGSSLDLTRCQFPLGGLKSPDSQVSMSFFLSYYREDMVKGHDTGKLLTSWKRRLTRWRRPWGSFKSEFLVGNVELHYYKPLERPRKSWISASEKIKPTEVWGVSEVEEPLHLN